MIKHLKGFLCHRKIAKYISSQAAKLRLCVPGSQNGINIAGVIAKAATTGAYRGNIVHLFYWKQKLQNMQTESSPSGSFLRRPDAQLHNVREQRSLLKQLIRAHLLM